MSFDLNPEAVSLAKLMGELNALVENGSQGLYSTEGLETLSILWTKVAAHQRLMYQATWLGRPIIQLPTDILVMQEVIWETRPDVIVETGVAHGGSLVLAASILKLMGGGKVIGVDVEIRESNREMIEAHPMSRRIELIEGDSVAEQTLARVRDLIPHGSRVMVVLDSNHSEEHVAKELLSYSEFVTPGCYLIAHDGAQFWVWDSPGARDHWSSDHPLGAIETFLMDNPHFRVDDERTRFGITSSPFGYLRKLEKS